MSAVGNLGLYGLALAAILGVALFAGDAAAPVGLATVDRSTGGHDGMGADGAGPGAGHGEMAMGPGTTLPGLARADDGYRLEPLSSTVEAASPTDYRFRIVADDGPVTDFDVEHDRRMHLIVVRRDMVGFVHQHPTMAEDGTWSTTLDLPDPGTYRVFADFVIGGEKHTLGVDLFVPGDFRPDPLPAPDRTADLDDGYTVTLDDGTLDAGAAALSFTVRRDGRVVDDLQPHLGARGHLVALRDGDLAFLHVHADADTLDFAASFPTPDRYRLFLQFRHDGEVRTAEFTVDTREVHP